MKGLYLRGSIWHMSFVVDGKQYQRSTGTSDRKRAERIYYSIKGKIADGRFFEEKAGEGVTLGELLAKYLEEHSSTKSLKSRVRDAGIVNHLLKFFGDVPLEHLTASRISDYIVAMRKKDYAAASINLERGLLSNAFNLAVRRWLMAKENPVLMVDKEKVNNMRDRWMSQEEERLFLSVSPEWLGLIIRFAVNTGLRQGEILDLKWSDVDLSRKTIYIGKQKNKGKDELPLNEEAMDVLVTRAKVRHMGKYHVFCGDEGKRLDADNLRHSWNRVLKKTGITDLRFHDLRSTFATRLAHAGVDPYTIQHLMRHRSTSMMQRYAHHNCESLRPGVERLDRQGESRFVKGG